MTEDQKELDRRLFDLGRIVLGKESGGMTAKLKAALGGDGAWNAIKAAFGTSEPREYVGAILRRKAEISKPPLSQEERDRLWARYKAKLAAQ